MNDADYELRIQVMNELYEQAFELESIQTNELAAISRFVIEIAESLQVHLKKTDHPKGLFICDLVGEIRYAAEALVDVTKKKMVTKDFSELCEKLRTFGTSQTVREK